MTARAMVAVAFLVVGCGGSRSWTTADTAWQGAVTASLAADYSQTRTALDAGYDEKNPIMGPSGDRIAPEVYFPACAAAAAGAAVALPRPWRRALQVAVLAVQVHTIAGNVHAGAGFGWTF